jgi:hypothetical protein
MQGLTLHSWEVVPEIPEVGDTVVMNDPEMFHGLLHVKCDVVCISEGWSWGDSKYHGYIGLRSNHIAVGYSFETFMKHCETINGAKDASLKTVSWDVVDMGEGKRIQVAYSLITPESAANGDFEDTGWLDEKGVEMSDLEGWDNADTPVDKAVGYLGSEGVDAVSSFPFSPGAWYIRVDNQENGNVMEYTYHLSGFTPEEEQEIYKQLF